MTDEKVLTKEIAEQFLADEDSVDLYEFTAIEDEAAEVLGASEADLCLDGLTSLSDAAAECLSKHERDLFLESLQSLSENAVESLSRNRGALFLNGFSSLSAANAATLAQYEGECLSLCGLARISDEAASALSAYNGELCVSAPLLSDSAAVKLIDSGVDIKGNWTELKGVMRLLFATTEESLRPKLPWRPGPPPIDLESETEVMQEHFLLIEEDASWGQYYRTVHAEVRLGDDNSVVWYEKVLCNENSIQRDGNPLTNVVCHAPCPEFEDVPEGFADAFVYRKMEAGTLTFVGADLPISRECAARLPQQETLTTLNILVETVADILPDLVVLPNLSNLTLMATELTVEHAQILAQFSGVLSIQSPYWYQPFAKISDEAATLLAGCRGSLNLSLEDLPESAAAILRKHPSFAEDG